MPTTQLTEAFKQGAQAPLESASSLPFEIYRDDGIYAAEVDAIWHNEWVFLAAEQQIPKPGDYFACTLGGEPVAVIRGSDGEVRALSNVCRHRGTPLLEEGFGSLDQKNIVCPYHAWTYDTKGALKAVPMPGSIEVNKAEHCLPAFHLHSWHGLLFVNLAKHPTPFTERTQGIDDYIAGFDLSRFTAGYQGEVEHWQSNWKLAMENAMESYHLFKVHKETLETVTPTRDAYYVAGSADWSLTGGRLVVEKGLLQRLMAGSYPDAYNHYILVSLPPSFVGVLTWESFGWIQVLPSSSTQSTIVSGGIAEGGGENRYESEFTQQFFAEDKAICEHVQKGMMARHSSGGKLVEMERVVVDFHQFLASRLYGSPTSAFYQSDEAEKFLSLSG